MSRKYKQKDQFMAKLEPTNTFHIAFDTKHAAGYIKTVKVTIENDVMDSMDTVRVDLCDHPLYPDLERYVLGNQNRRAK
jgi:hypothetical protein